MPMKPKKPCKHPGCPLLTDHSYCEFHAKLYADERAGARERGYDSRWRKARKQFLNAYPICKHCEKKGKIAPATVVDHITPHRGDQRLFWDESNWQPLCKKCHDRKTRTEDQHPVYTF
ncbi:HNH endonuclease [Halalkalibacter okhensis]|uniref:Putative HNH nuclease YajD n=1 Tax=Halalkalibacter okhensis TaxID=333138 RepID=A0A0B0IP72_9BACI|nr:HNH endonuclease signature motif containing protein [Halalkalibacter okhensis]KHF41466.1 HNH endonuclease [Halalkalibacter okhensis]